MDYAALKICLPNVNTCLVRSVGPNSRKLLGPQLTEILLCWDIRSQSMASRVTATGNKNEHGEPTETLRRSGLEMTRSTSHSHLPVLVT